MSDFTQVGIRLMVAVEQKVNLGNYESASVNVMLSNVPAWATDEDIDEALKTAKITFSKITDAVRTQVKAKRGGAKASETRLNTLREENKTFANRS